MKPTIKDIVYFKTKLASLKFGQATEEVATHPAIITRVHNDSCVDLTIFYNGSAPGFKNGVFQIGIADMDSWWEWPPQE